VLVRHCLGDRAHARGRNAGTDEELFPFVERPPREGALDRFAQGLSVSHAVGVRPEARLVVELEHVA